MRPSGLLCCFTAFAAAAFEFLAEREAVVRGTTNTTYRLAFVFAALCQRYCAGAFSSGLIQQHAVSLRQVLKRGPGPAGSLITAYDPQKKGFI